MSHFKGSNQTDNKNHVVQSSGDLASPVTLETPAPSTTLESSTTQESPTTLKPPKINSIQESKRKMFLLSLLMLFVDIILPLVLYMILSRFISVILALVISGIPPIISIILNFIFHRQVSITGILSLTGFIAGTIMSIIKGDARLYLLREPIMSCAVGLVLLITLIPIKVGSFQIRPLLFYYVKNLGMGNLEGLTEDEPIPERWERYWGTYAELRRTFFVLTAVWGFGLILDAPARILVIYNTKTIDQAVYFGLIIGIVWVNCLILFTIIYVKWRKHLFEKQSKKEEAAATVATANKEV
ncbi:16920_t:CDS:1 [Dentiscutata erythropus]|uniref:16920_t:CDS:1 n=1 Tax=Dentiscutata erythropus TaxID=1348616 RepID=A0A9N9N704_9GLOM|nr:16920_t:CDS:1 [Dentiscutata erythropus]